jgi:hypothetical protein
MMKIKTKFINKKDKKNPANLDKPTTPYKLQPKQCEWDNLIEEKIRKTTKLNCKTNQILKVKIKKNKFKKKRLQKKKLESTQADIPNM